MNWLVLSEVGNGVVAIAYVAIAGAIAVPLLRSGQWFANRLGSTTAIIFFTCAVGHGLHLTHSLSMPMMEKEGYTWHYALWDALTAVVAVYYWSLRGIYGSLMDGAKLFTDMEEQQRLDRAQAAQDLAEARLAAERERHANAAMVTTLIANSQALIYIKDLEGRYLLANEALQHAFGVQEADVLGRTDAEVDASHCPGWGRHEALARGGAVRVEATATTAAGPRVYDCAMFPLQDADGAVYATCAMATDVTRAKEAEHAMTEARDAALASAAARSSFLATMSHEVRTPINAVIGLTGLLLQSSVDDHQRDLLDTVRNSGEALLDVVNDVLDFSKIESGEVHLEARAFDVAAAVDNAVDLVAASAAIKGLDLITRIDPAVPTAVVGDVTRFRQVLLNLLSNAVKFTETGQIVLSVSAADEGPDALRLTAVVSDTGIGIPAEALDRLFDPFTQVDASTTRIYGGTGLGLAITRRLVEAMGGTAEAASEPGQGSRFTVNFRVAAVPTDPQPRWFDLRGGSVLLVADAGEFRTHLADQLRSWGVACTEVDDLAAAVRLRAQGRHWNLAVVPKSHLLADPGAAAELGDASSPARLPVVALTTLANGGTAIDHRLFHAELARPVRLGALVDALAPLIAPHPLLPGQRSDAIEVVAPVPPLRILLVEDNAVNQKVGRLLLASLGQLDVEIAANGREAVVAARQRPFDVVLMDVQMPELDGLGATREIRAMELAWPQPRIIALTAAASGADRDACQAAGMDDYLGKPLRVEALLTAMRGVTPTVLPATPGRRLLDPPVLDREVLRALLGQLGRTEDTSGDLLGEFLADCGDGLVRLDAALAAGDEPAIARVAHELRPTCALFGAAELAGLLAGLEGPGAGRPDRGALGRRVEAAYERLSSALATLAMVP